MKGFTLVELLVVVLIIGILAAVAVPQYQLAVAKSQYIEGMKMLDTMWNAQQVYYLANGVYAHRFEDLDVSLPDGMTYIENPSGQEGHYRNNKYWLDIVVRDNNANAMYMTLPSKAKYFRYLDLPGQKYCYGSKTSLWTSLCLSFGGQRVNDFGAMYVYTIP